MDLSDRKVQEDIKDFILIMLGAPIIKVELDKSQLDLCVQRTCNMMEKSDLVARWNDNVKLLVAQEGSLSLAKLILGSIRGKYGLDIKEVKTIPMPVDARRLLEEGEKEYRSWKLKVFGKITEK